MDFSSIKLVATDMDGTLLTSQHTLPPDFFPVFQELKARGIWFAAASGRQYYNLANVLAPIKDEVIFIAENGSYAVYQGEEILVQDMPLDLTRQLLQKAKTIENTHLVLCGKKTAYIESTHPAFLAQVNLYYDEVKQVEDLQQVENDQFLKIAICDLSGSEQNSNTYFQQEREFLQVTVSGKIWLDICHVNANKGHAMQVVQQKLGITALETMAFGDFLNDLQMVKQAHFGYAMANAHPEVQAAARFHTKSNDENGVLDVLYQVVAGQRIR